MERLKKERRPLRAVITKTANEVEAERAKKEPDQRTLRIRYEKLMEVSNQIMEMDQKILDAMLDDGCSDEQYQDEFAANEEYRDKARLTIMLINESLPEVRPNSPIGSSYSTAGSGSGSGERKKKTYKLPKIELKKFGGDLCDWLGFWSQFEKIHEDEQLHASDKFQYLVQSMVPGTRARELVDSYPQTADNYPKVVEALKERFGKKNLLMQVYVRGLLKLVISNNSTRDKVKVVQMFDKLESHLRALESLGVTKQQMAVFLYPMVESSLPEDTLIAWQRSSSYGRDGSRENPPKSELDYLMEFLKKEVESEDQRALVQSGFTSVPKKKVPEPRVKQQQLEVPTAAGLFSSEKARCIFCNNVHESRECAKAQMMSLEEKRSIVQEKKCCFGCLRGGHRSNQCKAFIKCPICSSKHPTIMCPELPRHRKPNKRETTTDKPKVEVETSSSNLACSSKVVLKTLMVKIVGHHGTKQVRALIDDGSQRSYITKILVEQLGLPAVGQEDIIHALFSGVQTSIQKHKKYDVQLKTGNGICAVKALDQEKICGAIPRVSRGPWMKELKQHKIWLSDIGDGSPSIDLLLGADVVGRLLTGNVVQLSGGLTAVETKLGWTLMGQFGPEERSSKSMAMIVTNLLISDSSVQDLWNLETIGIRDPSEKKSREEIEAETMQHFLDTVARNPDGRYQVSLPWVNGAQKLPSNRQIAEKRLLNSTTKLKAESRFGIYDQVFKDWENEGIIEVVPKEEIEDAGHYLPHRAVVKPDSLTTPVRPVFDASCKMQRTPSLNECLEKGPNLLERIPSLLLRFREKKIGIISDIRKAFLMIEMKKEDRNFLRFLWWEDSATKEFKVYRHRRVVFGVNCSPFLLGAVIEYHLKSVAEEDRRVADKLLRSLYVDNCVASEDTIEECKSFKDHATRIMADAKMELRQWEFGSGEVPRVGQLASWCGLGAGRSDSREAAKEASVLGYKWDKDADSIGLDLWSFSTPERVTKRIILSYTQKIFDPIGFTCPVTLQPKLMLQSLWKDKMDWDSEVPDVLQVKFKTWCEDLKFLQQVKIPRNVTRGMGSRENWQLHTFCDASQDAYATVVFLRTCVGSEVNVQLVQAKSRVAPLKTTSIPRLELLGCTIAARLSTSVKEALSLENVPEFYWTDSSTALAWIQRNDEWGTFVGNRVKEICKLTQVADWRHVPGVRNPADLPSRGCSPSKLLESTWWEGPAWLRGPQEEWELGDCEVDEVAVSCERKKGASVTLIATAKDEDCWYAKRSSYRVNVRILAWIKRFINNSRVSGTNKMYGSLSVYEVDSAEKTLLKMVQKETLQGNQEYINGIRVVKDEDGLIRIKTKLLHRDDSFGFKYPVLLPNSHVVVDQIIREEHLKNQHAGAQFLMGNLREKFWILQGRRVIRKVLQQCVTCLRFTAKKPNVIPASLPADRVNTSKVFEIVGVDLAGPLFLKTKEKAWIVLFTCAVFRGVHLELVQSLSTDAFLDAFSRFMDRRGRPSIVYSDNGTNFIGAVNAFNELDWDKIVKHCGLKKIQWKLNPPSAAWWGGWWERLVKTTKELLRRILGKSSLTYEKLMTCLCDIEAVINGRPLTTVTEDPNDLSPLTPAMFMQEVPCANVTEQELLEASGFQKLFASRKNILEQFKLRFRKEYLADLVQRGKERKIKKFEVGDVVLIGSDNKRRWEWPLARIVELMPGKDGNVRVAKVKTASGFLLRPVQRLFPMEVSSSAENQPIQQHRKEKVIKVQEKAAKVITRCGRESKIPDRFGQ